MLENRKYILLAITVLFVYLSPNIFFPEKARFLIHDNMDSNVVWYKNLAGSGKLFSANHEAIPNSLGGLPRGCYPSEFNILHLLYLIFPPLVAYNINSILIHLLAFFSMYIYSRKYIFKYSNELYTVLVALIFSLLPFWPSGGAAITAQPLLLYAFLNIYHKDLNWKNWLIIFLIPFYSVLVFSNMFFIILAFVLFIGFSIKSKTLNYYFIFALGLFTITSVVAEYRLFVMQFVEKFESHRSIISTSGSINFKGFIGVSILHFAKGQYHFLSMQFPLILLTCLVAFFKATKVERKTLLALLSIIFITSLIFVLPDWNVVAAGFARSSILSSVQLRFHSLLPLLWFVVFAYSINSLIKLNSIFRVGSLIVCCCFIVSLFFSIGVKDYFGNDYAENAFYNTYVNKTHPEHSSFKQYYKTDLFETMKRKLPPGDYHVGCLGFSPEIAQFNGYNTIDGYFYYYSKAYNKVMCDISAKEMLKSDIKSIGSHCGLISSELNSNKSQLTNLELDFEKMKQIGTKYIFSIKPILSPSLIDEQVFKVGNRIMYSYTIN